MRKQFAQAAAIAAAVLLVGGGVASAQQAPDTAQPKSTPQDQGTSTHHARAARAHTGASTDQAFIRKAAEGGVAEVEFGKLATQKASSNEVKQFGQRMVDDHGKANDQLKSIAQQKNVTIPSQLAGQAKREYDRLAKLSGEQFDRAYMRMMVSDHRKDVNEFRRESKTAKDTDVKQFASNTLPTLEEHLKQAQQTASSVGAEARATSGKRHRRATGTSGTKSANPQGATGTHETPGSVH